MKKRMWFLLQGLLLLTGCATFERTGTFSFLQGLFYDLNTKLRLDNADAVAMTWVRIILFIAIFALMYFGAEKVFGHEKKGISIVVSLALALLATIAIPKEIVLQITQTYSWLFGLLFAILPAIVCVVIAHKLFDENTPFHGILRVILYGISSYVIFTFSTAFYKTLESQGAALGDWLNIAGVVLLIAAVWNVFGLFGGAVTSKVEEFQSSRERTPERRAAQQEQGEQQQRQRATETVATAEAQKKEATKAAAEKSLLEQIKERAKNQPTKL